MLFIYYKTSTGLNLSLSTSSSSFISLTSLSPPEFVSSAESSSTMLVCPSTWRFSVPRPTNEYSWPWHVRRCFRKEFILVYSSGQPSTPHLTLKFGIPACSTAICLTKVFNVKEVKSKQISHFHERAIFDICFGPSELVAASSQSDRYRNAPNQFRRREGSCILGHAHAIHVSRYKIPTWLSLSN